MTVVDAVKVSEMEPPFGLTFFPRFVSSRLSPSLSVSRRTRPEILRKIRELFPSLFPCDGGIRAASCGSCVAWKFARPECAYLATLGRTETNDKKMHPERGLGGREGRQDRSVEWFDEETG